MPANSKAARHWLIPVATWTFLLATAVFSKPFRYSAAHVAMLAALYLLMALLLHLPALLALRWGKFPTFIAVAAAAFVLALHFREQTRPSGTAESLDKTDVLVWFIAGWVAAAMVYFAVLWLLRPRDTEPAAGILLLVATPLFFGLLALSFHASNTFRWHLLRHNTLLGALSHHLLAEETSVVRAALWGQHATDVLPLADPPGAMISADGAPDIVFVLIDTLRVDALAATGGEGGLMPYVDELARESFVFADVKTNASWTFPSMASFLTGLLPEEHGAVWESALGPDKLTLAEALAARGYRTAAFVANGAWMREDRGMAQGFDEFHQLGTGGATYPRAEQVNAAVVDFLEQTSSDPSPASGGGRQAANTETRVSAGQRTDDAARPSFLYVHYMDPHVPYLSAGVVDPASHEDARAAYETELRYLDLHLRELMESLAARVARPTWTFIVADHGEEFGEHGERGHGRALYDEVLRVPVLLHRGDARQYGVIDDKLEGRDFFSLLLALSSGKALDVPGWARAQAREERYASTYYTNRSAVYGLLRPYRAAICLQVIEKDGYTLIWSGQGNTYELYDMHLDPAQHNNIADLEPEVVTRLAAAMRAAPAYWTPEVRGTFDPDDLERLRALGYLR